MGDVSDEDKRETWDDPKYLKSADCDELGYCIHCRTATHHREWCVVMASDSGQSQGGTNG